MHKGKSTLLQRRGAILLGPLAILAAALLAAYGGLASAAGTRTGGRFHIYEADPALAGNQGTVILTGAITDHGTDHQGPSAGKFNKEVLSKGSFEMNLARFGKKLVFPVNPKTCAASGTVKGQVTIVKGSGTGAYRGIRGTFEATVSEASNLPRLRNGKCNTSAKKYPGVLIGNGSGTVSYK